MLNTNTNEHVRGTAIMHGHTEWPVTFSHMAKIHTPAIAASVV